MKSRSNFLAAAVLGGSWKSKMQFTEVVCAQVNWQVLKYLCVRSHLFCRRAAAHLGQQAHPKLKGGEGVPGVPGRPPNFALRTEKLKAESRNAIYCSRKKWLHKKEPKKYLSEKSPGIWVFVKFPIRLLRCFKSSSWQYLNSTKCHWHDAELSQNWFTYKYMHIFKNTWNLAWAGGSGAFCRVLSELLALSSAARYLPNSHGEGLDSLGRLDFQVGEKGGMVKTNAWD